MNRRAFVWGAGLLAASPLFGLPHLAAAPIFPVVRPAARLRHFRSRAVENAIAEFGRNVKDPELAWLFNNCFPNTLDTTVTPGTHAGRPDTFVITGDIDAMWLRDSSAQVWPYLSLLTQDAPLRQLVAGVINRQTRCILQDPYANAFYQDPSKVGEWKADQTAMQPGVHERKWEIDSLCYPIRLGYHYWKITGDDQPFDAQWRQAIALTLQTFREQQRKTGPGPYHFQRLTTNALDTQPLAGYGYPGRPCGLIASAFRPSDDATLHPFLVPSNFFAVVSLRQAFLMMADIAHDNKAAQECRALSDEIARPCANTPWCRTPNLALFTPTRWTATAATPSWTTPMCPACWPCPTSTPCPSTTPFTRTPAGWRSRRPTPFSTKARPPKASAAPTSART